MVTEYRAAMLVQEGITQLIGCSDSPRLDAEVLLQAACGINRTTLARNPCQLVDPQSASAFFVLLKRRSEKEPIACILGHKEFWSLDIELNEATLVPRSETEILVQAALDAIPPDTAVDVADLGTGSGAIALALAIERPLARITATDISRAALAKARENASRLGVDILFVEGDWFTPLAGSRFDVIVSNPPYVRQNDPVLETGPALFEPALALFAGEDGLDCIRALCVDLKSHIKPGGLVALEHGHDQQDAVYALLSATGLESIVHVNDYAGLPRVTSARGSL
ncbi:MAG TPA: peptide chain release factor N(5)-glutamine methyltransferase [Gammaproteobacteria bacterium]|nr:peptide chain release factor N(5)-glutamine methyltransferase [Gammaproteobacteria bacterium]